MELLTVKVSFFVEENLTQFWERFTQITLFGGKVKDIFSNTNAANSGELAAFVDGIYCQTT